MNDGALAGARAGSTARPAVARRIDAHLHLWQLAPGRYPWLVPQRGELYRSFEAHEARAELTAAGFDGAVLVQAEDSSADTRFMLEVAEANPWVLGVVGWVPLDDPARAEQALAELTRHRRLCGIRHLVHDDPRDGFLELTAVRRSLRLVAEAGLAFDVPDAWPRHLGQARGLASELPQLTVVIDHLAKPPFGSADFDDWAAELRRVAALPNTVAKVSGLRMPGIQFTADALHPAWQVALEAFGPHRLLYGGDWPMTVPAGGYAPTWQVMQQLIGELSASERASILGGTAERVYRLAVEPG
ncbi:MAG TPA: amidohydrolase family protein [Humibacter sp.]|jgi:L-fuconolactonase|nr:amidohydrolase family protein [Humibacter sp.]